ncbi:hypothetical protein MHU86_9696 [Fragilaria crotonensis]|nr:hypothetical protein MHU86_9696 [Fragilaria crotonensis]
MVKSDSSIQRRRHALVGLQNSSSPRGIAAKHALRFVSFCILIALASGQSAVCYICGYGFKVGNRDAIISIDGQPNVPCGALEDGGLNNRITEQECDILPGIVFDVCECVNDNLGSPTDTPSDPPVPAPVAPDTEEPTSLPQATPEPSQQATPEPSQQATSEPVAPPTSPPVEPPTSQPVVQPTLQPVAPPTSQPVAQPTSPPVAQPTTPPVEQPTSQPVAQPTSQPVESPVPRPSPKPNLDPNPTPPPTMATTTAFPVESPTRPPTESATTDGPTSSALPTTKSPSNAPSTTPSTKRPTFRPTVSKSPSSLPTPTPSGILPTFSPFPTAGTDEPTVAESPMTEAPSLAMQSYLIEVVMFMEGVTEELDGGSEITFQTETARHIRNDFLPDLEDLTVGTNIKEEEVLLPSSTRGRRLQATTTTVTVTTLKIVFDTAVAFRSPTDNLDVAALIGLAFDTADDREAYIRRLQSVGGQPFTSITSISIEINGVPQNVKQEQTQVADSGGVGLPVIIGASVGGAALVAIAIFAFLRRRKPKANYDDNFTFASSKKDLGHEHVNTNIIVEPQDDISTLGDPMPGVLMLQQDEKSQDSLLQSHSSTNGNTDDDGLSVEESLALDEKRFEVTAPAGKLGMVIDTPNGGAPVVHAIKNTSSLADTGIQVGDRLVAIDGIDTTCLTAMQVSKLISQKANNPSRVLEFVRVRPGVPPQ